MGNSQLSSRLDKPHYLAVSPYPLVSLVNSPARTSAASAANSSSNNNSITSGSGAGVIQSDPHRSNVPCTVNKEDRCEQNRLPSENTCEHNCKPHTGASSNLRCCHQLCTLRKSDDDASTSSKPLEYSLLASKDGSIYRILNSNKNVSASLSPHFLTANSAPLASMKECMSQGEVPDSCSRHAYHKDSDLLQDIHHTKKGALLTVDDLTFKLLVAESILNEMTEADRNYTFHGDLLVEQGMICGPPDRTPPQLKLDIENSGQHVEPRREGSSSEAQTGQFEVVNGSRTISAGNFYNYQPILPDSSTRNDASSETRTYESTAPDTDNFDHLHLSVSEPPVRRDTFSEVAPGGPQTYMDPVTGEFHSLVFGSFAGNATSMTNATGTFSHTQRINSVISGNFTNSSIASFGTECFSNVHSRDSFHNSNSDFVPPGELCVLAGKADPFESFNDDRDFSGEQDCSTFRAEASGCQGSCGQSNEPARICVRDLHIPATSSVHPDTGHWSNSPPRTQDVVSLCESCGSMGVSQLVQTFGSPGPVCESCTCHSQSLAADTNSFTVAPGSMQDNQGSKDSWMESFPGSKVVQTNSHCFIDYGDDSQDLCNSDCDMHACNGSQFKVNSCMNRKSWSFSGPSEKVDECEIATEDYGIGRETDSDCPAKMFGQQSSKLGRRIIESQMVAKSKFRGTNTEEFSPGDAVSGNGMCCKLKTTRFDSSLCSGGNRHATTKMACGSDSQRHFHDTDQDVSVEIIDDKQQHFKSTPKQKSFTESPPTKFNGIDKRKCEGNLDSETNDWHRFRILSSLQDKAQHAVQDNGNTLNNGARSKVHTPARQASSEKVDKVEPDGGGKDKEGEDRLCRMRIPHSRSPPCDCSYLFKQNYVAYLCCAPEDLSFFGLAFHRTLEEWGFRIFIAPRDLDLTGPKYENMAHWLEERCNGKIIIVLSNNYGNSEECLFLTYFARTLDPDARNRNIIPVMIDRDVNIPNVLKGLSIIKYNYDTRCGWLKKKLVNAIAA